MSTVDYLSADVRIWILVAASDAILLADPMYFLDERDYRIELFVRLTNRHFELFVGINETLSK